MNRILFRSAVSVAAALALSTLLGGCVTANPDVVSQYETGRMGQVLDATVISVRPVTVGGQQSGMGAVAGGAVGTVAGSSVGGYRDQAAGAVIGAIVGAVVGNAVEKNATQQNGLEIIVQLRNGERRAIIQGQGAEVFAPGDAVMLVTSAGRTRVTHAGPPAPPPPAR
ncbi:MAG: glycine zipper 2TM domain-containing protein [Pelomonas sp.]|nr:glycine zipper 2TM domain-containing protein [Roseateles sp.]